MTPERRISTQPIGQIRGSDVTAYTLRNRHGVEATVFSYGAILAEIITPDSSGHRADVLLGFDRTAREAWEHNPAYFGGTIGRFANRIAHGHFQLDGKHYHLDQNNDPGGIRSALHGGIIGFDKKHFTAETATTDSSARLSLKMTSRAGEEGYPGTLNLTIVYELDDENQLTWQATATTDAPTVVNIVNHSYWNLSGQLDQSIEDHVAQIEAQSYLPTNAGLIPTGEIFPVEFTPLDFTEPQTIGDRIDAPFEPLELARGYDHAFLLNNAGQLRHCAAVFHPTTGRSLEVATNQPAVHFYTGNWVDDTHPGKNGATYSPRCGFCLETENYPDAPNNPNAPCPILRPGETYHHQTVYKFGW